MPRVTTQLWGGRRWGPAWSHHTTPPSGNAAEQLGLLPGGPVRCPHAGGGHGESFRRPHCPEEGEAVAREGSRPVVATPRRGRGPTKQDPEQGRGPVSGTQGWGIRLWPCAQAWRKRMWPLTSRLQSWPGGKVNRKLSRNSWWGPACARGMGSAAGGGARWGCRRMPASDTRGAEPGTGQKLQTAVVSGHGHPCPADCEGPGEAAGARGLGAARPRPGGPTFISGGGGGEGLIPWVVPWEGCL